MRSGALSRRIFSNPTTKAEVFTVYLKKDSKGKWLRGPDLNRRPSGYEPDELPGCSTPRLKRGKFYSFWVKNANTAGIWCTETGRKICRHYSDPRHILSTFIANHVNEYPVHFHLLNTFAFSCSPLSALFYKKHTKLFLSPIKDD